MAKYLSGRPPKIRRFGPGRPPVDRRVSADVCDRENGICRTHSPSIVSDSSSGSSASISPFELVPQVS